jgi:hypothetical protein
MKSVKKGSVALTTVILISGLLLIGGLTVIVVSIDVSRISRIVSDAEIARIQSTTCFEEGLLQMKQNELFLGEVNLDNCSYTIANTVNPDIRMMEIASEAGPYSYSRMYRVDISTTPYTVSEDDMLQ